MAAGGLQQRNIIMIQEKEITQQTKAKIIERCTVEHWRNEQLPFSFGLSSVTTLSGEFTQKKVARAAL